MASQSLSFDFVGRDVSAGSAFSKLGGDAEKAGGHFQSLGSKLTAFAAGGALAVVGLGKAAIDMADKFETSRSRLESITHNIGGNFSDIASQVAGLDSRMAKFGFTNDQVESSMASLMAATKNSAKSMQDVALAADIARGRNISLEAASQLLVKVETGHVSLLGRLGIATKDATGHTISQQQAMQKLTDLYGGAASQYAGTFAGKQAAVGAALKNAGAQIGVALIPVLTKFAQILTADIIPALSATVQWVSRNGEIIKPLAEGVLIAVAAWKAYELATKAAAFANMLLGRSATATIGPLTEEAAAARAAQTSRFGGGAAALPIIGVAVAGASFAKGYTDSQNAASQQRMIAFAQQGASAVAKLRQEYVALGTVMEHQSGVTRSVSEGLRNQMKAALDSVGATDKGTAASRAATQAASAQGQAITALTAKMAADTSAVLNMQGSYDGFRQLLNDLPGVVKQNGTALQGYSDKAIANRGALAQLVQGIQAHIANMKAAGKSTDAQNRALTTMEGQLRQTAAATFGSGKAVDEWLRKVGMMPGQTKRALAGLGTDGSQAGTDLGAGLVAGMQQKMGAVTAQAKVLADAAVKSIRLAAQTNSPSKLTIITGQEIADGLAVGFGYHMQQVVGKLGGYTQYLIGVVQQKVSDGLTSIHDTMIAKIQKVTDALAVALAKIQSTVQTAKDNLNATLSARSQFADSIAQGVAGQAGLGGLFDSSGAMTGSVGNYLTGKLSQFKKFAADLAKLRKAGLGGALLSQIAQLPVDQGIAVAEQIIGSGFGTVQALNQVEGQIDATAGKIGGNAAGSVYDSQVAAQTANLKAVEQTATKAAAAAHADAQAQIKANREEAGKTRQALMATLQAVIALGAKPTGAETRAALLKLKSEIGALGLA